MRPLNRKAREALDKLTAAFDTPEILLDTLARAALIPNTSPCSRWSAANRFLVSMHGTSDARGFRQWIEVGRSVKKGSRAFHILVPAFKTREEDGEEQKALAGFLVAAVFPIEATEGEPLLETVPTRIPRLRAVADALGITITYSGAVSEKVLGVYTHDRHDGTGATGQIKLYTLDVATFYHELAHALHHRTGLLREGKSEASKRDNEVVAEISAAVLVRLIEGEEVGRQALQYVTSYGAKKAHLLSLLPEIMGVLDLALELGTTNYDAPVLAVANQ